MTPQASWYRIQWIVLTCKTRYEAKWSEGKEASLFISSGRDDHLRSPAAVWSPRKCPHHFSGSAAPAHEEFFLLVPEQHGRQWSDDTPAPPSGSLQGTSYAGLVVLLRVHGCFPEIEIHQAIKCKTLAWRCADFFIYFLGMKLITVQSPCLNVSHMPGDVRVTNDSNTLLIFRSNLFVLNGKCV